MYPAPTLTDVSAALERGASGVVGLLFAPYPSRHAELILERLEYLDERSGRSFHLFFAGYQGYGDRSEVRPVAELRYHDGSIIPWGFNQRLFSQFVAELEGATSWRYGGGTELILISPRRGLHDALTCDVEMMLRDGAISSIPQLLEATMRLRGRIDLDLPFAVQAQLALGRELTRPQTSAYFSAQNIGRPSEEDMAGEVSEFAASVAFLKIENLPTKSTEDRADHLAALHAELRNRFRPRVGDCRVLSSPGGAIVVLPDSHSTVKQFLTNVTECATNLARGGVVVRVGVTAGDATPVKDVDGTPNLLSRAINVAARVAYSDLNRGILVEKSFFSDHDLTGKIADLDPISVKGKEHDPKPYDCRLVAIVDLPSGVGPPPHLDLPAVTGVIVAYDLPRFSEGDQGRLRSRFGSVAEAVKRAELKQFNLSPGGDGGILVLTEARARGLRLVEDMVRNMNLEHDHKAEGAGALARVGIHYGSILLYDDAEGGKRPTGTPCVIADAIATGTDAGGHPIFSGTFCDAAGGYSDKLFGREFEKIVTLQKGPAAGIDRYRRRMPDADRVGTPTVIALPPPGPSPSASGMSGGDASAPPRIIYSSDHERPIMQEEKAEESRLCADLLGERLDQKQAVEDLREHLSKRVVYVAPLLRAKILLEGSSSAVPSLIDAYRMARDLGWPKKRETLDDQLIAFWYSEPTDSVFQLQKYFSSIESAKRLLLSAISQGVTLKPKVAAQVLQLFQDIATREERNRDFRPYLMTMAAFAERYSKENFEAADLIYFTAHDQHLPRPS